MDNMNDTLSLIGRSREFFRCDMKHLHNRLSEVISESSFLVLGAAGSIGQAVTKEIFKRSPKKLHITDISENNIVELVRDIRSSFGYINGDFQALALDIGSLEYDAFIKQDGQYDYVLNLSALKHVRSEKDPYTLMRMIDVNILNTIKTLQQAIDHNAKKYFCVSTDKATDPINMMGASKRVMEMFLMHYSKDVCISTARFANVAFSDGSLLHSFEQRLKKQQPIVAPDDIKRYFLTQKEAGELCLLSCIFGDNRDIFFPKLKDSSDLVSFVDIALKYLESKGLVAQYCSDENEARSFLSKSSNSNLWPCLFSKSDTTGEKFCEEFYSHNELVNQDRFDSISVIKNKSLGNSDLLNYFEQSINHMRSNGVWDKNAIIDLFSRTLPNFDYQDIGKYLDSKM